MRLCKEDNTPNAVLSRKVPSADGSAEEIPFVPSLPTAPDATSEIANETPEETRGEPCLFQGSIGCAYNLQALQENGITHILTAAANIGQRFKDQMSYKVLNLLDTPTQNMVEHFEEATDWIDEVLRANPQNKVLVHCFAGKSRASTIMCAYLMRK